MRSDKCRQGGHPTAKGSDPLPDHGPPGPRARQAVPVQAAVSKSSLVFSFHYYYYYYREYSDYY